MPKYKVALSTPYMVWEKVEAKSKEDALRQCDYPPEFDLNDDHTWSAIELEEDDEEDGTMTNPDQEK